MVQLWIIIITIVMCFFLRVIDWCFKCLTSWRYCNDLLPMFIKEISITTLTTKHRPNRISIPLTCSVIFLVLRYFVSFATSYSVNCLICMAVRTVAPFKRHFSQSFISSYFGKPQNIKKPIVINVPKLCVHTNECP